MSDQLLLPLAAVGPNDLAEVGGKAANLGELLQLGMPVPDGFVITTGSYRLGWGADEFPPELRQQVIDAYHRLGDGPVAVRSSATAEDLPGAAFAGQQDSYIDIQGDDALIDAVQRCWASLWTDRASSYRARLGIAPEEVSMAVVVQRMVAATVAGVMFTADPVSGDREVIIIESAAGLGEAVVSGTVTPDHYRVDRTGSVLEHRSSPSPDGELRPGELRGLADLGRQVHDHFGRPMDIEWTVVRAAEPETDLQLVQARPITALPPEPITLTRWQRQSNQVVLDYLPVRPYPLDVTTWTVRGPAEMLNRMAASIGLELDLMAGLHESDAVVDSFHPVSPRPTPKIITALPSLIRRIRRYPVTAWREDPRYRRFRDDLDALQLRPLPELDWTQLLQQIERGLAAADIVSDLRVDYLPNAGRAIQRLMISCLLLGRKQLFGDLLTGAPTITRAANDRLAELARLVAEDPTLVEDPRDPGFTAAVEEFLQDYGSRETDSPLLVSSPTWIDDPEHVWQMIIMLSRSVGPSDVDQAKSSRRATEKLLSHPLLRTASQRARLRRRIAEAQAGVALREDTHFEMTRPLPVIRHALLEIGRRLAEAEVTRDGSDVWHLRWSEIERLGPPAEADATTAANIRRTVEQRKAVREQLGSTPLINLKRSPVRGNALLSGTPASSGRASGAVRVVRGRQDFSALQAGEVLVCPYTNPSWTPLFQRASAVVADTGGPGSHAAIVAREYGIPAVMGTIDGTRRLTDGQQVTVDGDHGQVF